jgi:hypothetical protein
MTSIIRHSPVSDRLHHQRGHDILSRDRIHRRRAVSHRIAGKALANNNGTIGATDVSDSGDEVIVSDAASVMWTATASGSGFTLANNGYYVQRASSSGGGKPSISNNPNTSYYVWNYSNNRLSTAGSNSTYYLYYSSGWAQTNSSSSAGTVTIYSTTKPLTPQNLSFAVDPVVKIWGEDCIEGTSFPVQTVSNAHTTVTYRPPKRESLLSAALRLRL